MWKPAWLYGPEPNLDGGPLGERINLGARVINITTIREIVEQLEDIWSRSQAKKDEEGRTPPPGDPLPESLSWWTSGHAPKRYYVDVDFLDDAPTWQLERMQVQLQLPRIGNGGRVSLWWVPNEAAVISLSEGKIEFVDGSKPLNFGELAREIAEKVIQESPPRPRWAALARGLPWLTWLGLVAAWVWFLASEGAPASLIVFGSVIVIGMAVLARITQDRFNDWIGKHAPGTRVRQETRAAVRQRRADRHAGLRDASVGAAIGVLGTVLVALLIR